jgi:hypothetical protein
MSLIPNRSFAYIVSGFAFIRRIPQGKEARIGDKQWK